MANNKVSSLLNVDLPKPKRSNFNLGRVNRFTADVGWVIPCYVEEILPNSYKRLDVEALIQTNATVAPLMGSFKVKVDAFFVPLRLYHRHLDLNNIRPGFSDDFDFHYIDMPFNRSLYVYRQSTDVDDVEHVYTGRSIYATSVWPFDYPGQNATEQVTLNLQVAPSSLLDYLGVLPAGYNAKSWDNDAQFRLNATPFIAYFDIWRNYYSNPHDPQVPFRQQNFINSSRVSVEDNIYKDVFYKLECFDNFINSINTQSLTTSTSTPVALNVIDIFQRTFTRALSSDPSQIQFLHPPLFSGEAVGEIGSDTNLYKLYDTRDGIHFGLLPRTYMDDYFNSRFRNDFVTYMEESSRVQVVNNEFTITQLRMQNRIAKYVDKSIFSDTRFGSWIKAHFGVKTNQKLNIPQFLGSITSNIVFNDIYASAQTGQGGVTSNQALGSRASLGQGYIKNKGSFIEFQATEPGYLMCTFSIIPYVSYFQGIKKMYLKTSFNDVYKPEFDAVGYDDLQKIEMFAVGQYSNPYNNNAGIEPVNLASYNTSVGKHPAWLEYMTSYDEAHGLMTQRYQYGFWVLNRPFSSNVYDEVTIPVSGSQNFSVPPFNFNASTYIRPEYFNTIFAVDKYTDNFQVQMRFYDKTKQPISKQILPHL